MSYCIVESVQSLPAVAAQMLADVRSTVVPMRSTSSSSAAGVWAFAAGATSPPQTASATTKAAQVRPAARRVDRGLVPGVAFVCRADVPDLMPTSRIRGLELGRTDLRSSPNLPSTPARGGAVRATSATVPARSCSRRQHVDDLSVHEPVRHEKVASRGRWGAAEGRETATRLVHDQPGGRPVPRLARLMLEQRLDRTLRDEQVRPRV